VAKWRAIHASIATDEKVNRLSEVDQLLYERMVVKADDWGIITGDSFGLKLETVPASSRTLQELADALQEMEKLSLIWQYQPDGCGPLVQIRKFDDHQPGDLIRKRTVPHLPLHPDWQPMVGDDRSVKLLEDAGFSEKCMPRVDKSRVDKSRVDKNRVEEKQPPLFSVIFEQITGTAIAGHDQAEEINAWMEDVSEDWFRDACKEAADNNKRSWSYVRAILQNWKAGGKHAKRGKRDRELTDQQRAFIEAAESQQRGREADA